MTYLGCCFGVVRTVPSGFSSNTERPNPASAPVHWHSGVSMAVLTLRVAWLVARREVVSMHRLRPHWLVDPSIYVRAYMES